MPKSKQKPKAAPFKVGQRVKIKRGLSHPWLEKGRYRIASIKSSIVHEGGYMVDITPSLSGRMPKVYSYRLRRWGVQWFVKDRSVADGKTATAKKHTAAAR